MSTFTALLNRAWRLASLPAASRFERALEDPVSHQNQWLHSWINRNSETAFGRKHAFRSIRSVEDFRKAVPIQSYEEIQPWINRICCGEPHVLTRQKVLRLLPSSGSSGPYKLIPMTGELMASFQEAVFAWIHQLFSQQPELMGGSAYWAISPALAKPVLESVVPIGFEDDSAYFGRWFQPFLRRIWPVPSTIQHADSIERFQELTLLHLLLARDLRLISIWHPSFLSILLDRLTTDWDRLLHILTDGKTYQLPDQSIRIHQPDLAEKLSNLEPDAYHRIWPQLRHVSAWADGHASGPAQHLLSRLPGIQLEPKGLLCTEGVVSFPYRGHWPLALNSCFFEFEDEESNWVPFQELEVGKPYGVILTNRGGLYRYRLHDWVKVEGFLKKTPSIRFLGKKDCVSDLVGEKLNEVFVDQCLKEIGLSGRALLVPVRTPAHYRLILDPEVRHPAQMINTLDEKLCLNPHYAYARQLGQLGPLQGFWTNRNPVEADFRLAEPGSSPLSTQKVFSLAPVVSH